MPTRTKAKPRAKKASSPSNPESAKPKIPARLVLPRKAKPSAAVDENRMRPTLCHPYVMQVNGHRELIATDSYILVRLRVDDATPLGPIHVEALKQIEKGVDHTLDDGGKVTIDLDDKGKVEYSAPQLDRLQPFDKLPEAEFPEDETVSVAFNPTLLAAIVTALGGNAATSVSLDIRVDEQRTTLRPMRVRPTSTRNLDGHCEALLMPIRLNV